MFPPKDFRACAQIVGTLCDAHPPSWVAHTDRSDYPARVQTLPKTWLPLADGFTAAALGTQTWQPALAALAAATGSRASQLIALDGNSGVAMNLFTGLDPSIHDDYIA